MNNLKSILVGEDLHPLKTSITKIGLFPEIEVVSALNNCEDALKSVFSIDPDFLFLDISLLISNSCGTMIQELKNRLKTSVIFILPESAYLIEYFEKFALDYVVRPFDTFRLDKSLRKVMARHDMKKALGTKNQSIEDIITQLLDFGGAQTSTQKSPANQDAKLCVTDSGSRIFIPVSDINWIEAAGDYMCINTTRETFVTRSTLKALLKKLDDGCFIRIHRSTIINISKIRKVSHQSKGDYDLTLSCGKQLKVSRNYNNSINMLI
jgi:two-component system LytT family response regulator